MEDQAQGRDYAAEREERLAASERHMQELQSFKLPCTQAGSLQELLLANVAGLEARLKATALDYHARPHGSKLKEDAFVRHILQKLLELAPASAQLERHNLAREVISVEVGKPYILPCGYEIRQPSKLDQLIELRRELEQLESEVAEESRRSEESETDHDE